jgi:hypothetical protein
LSLVLSGAVFFYPKESRIENREWRPGMMYRTSR